MLFRAPPVAYELDQPYIHSRTEQG